ncbi:ABC transporter ATP-binding protein [Amygdalobacter indicium]|uniref:ABC transporter ATP-binding protein n=1 Tax=Amygdalobacter indicium TaxID=3029272 RepID=A0ABY8C4U5_9FIRM|nr:ABC transporter ATP-binding protein [Amygdalobacter indicium]WEG35713.1 ABC transporter ATP-binding protein [Amygdalobacter indicium]
MLKIKDLRINYGQFVAVDNLNITVNKGEFFTFLGPSGCGKTTTLRAIAGFINPSNGRIFINDEDITGVPVERRGLGMVFQSYALFPTMTVFDNIAYGLTVDKMPKSKINERVLELATLVDLAENQLKRNVSELSGGQQQRVAIARALARKPSVVLFDEPLSNLDAKLRKQLRSELKAIQREAGMTAIYVTHDQEEALELSDHIAVFNNGFIEQVGTPEEIYDHSATEFVCTFIGDSNLLPPALMEKINEQSGSNFDLSKRHYIRPEKIKVYQLPDGKKCVKLPAVVLAEVYQGTFSTVYLDVYGQKLKMINKKDGNFSFKVQDRIEVYINLEHILEYEEKKQ